MRKDGKKVKMVDPMYTLAPYFMVERYDAQNMTTMDVPYDPIHDYVLAKRQEGYKFSHLSVIMSALVRTISEYNQLNRFVVRSQIYAHNELTAGMVVLRPNEINPSMDKVKLDIYDTIFEVHDKMTEFINKNNKEDSSNDSDKFYRKVLSMPWLVRFAMGLLRWADRHNLLPKSIIDISPFHNSFVITNLASIRTNAIYHHIYGFGTCGFIMAMGTPKEMAVKGPDGSIVMKKFIPLGCVMDERLATGVYYVKAFARFQEYLNNPYLLEVPPKDENVHVDYEFESLSKKFKKEK